MTDPRSYPGSDEGADQGFLSAEDREALDQVYIAHLKKEIERLRAPAQPTIGTREVLDALADKVAAKIGQLEYYKANECQLDHARVIAEGRISQANQILHWIAEAAIQHSPSVSSTDRGGK